MKREENSTLSLNDTVSDRTMPLHNVSHPFRCLPIDSPSSLQSSDLTVLGVTSVLPRSGYKLKYS